LQALRDEFRWSVAEHWVRGGEAYRLFEECHSDSTLLDVFALGSAEVLVPPEWISPERWLRDPTVAVSPGHKTYWLKDATTSDLVFRHELVSTAGLNTLVFIPVPNGSYIQRAIIVLDFPAREVTTEELQALTIAGFCFGMAVPWDSEEASDSIEAELTTRLDPDSRCLVGPNGRIRLTVYEWDLLSILFKCEGHAVSFGELTGDVWQVPEEYVSRAVIYQVIGRLRKHLSAVSRDCRIASISRYGYVLERMEA
jgi:DNA-binding winged helix-turn-helix (wHTH) protein